MKRLDLTLPTIAENLALDEALLDKVVDYGPTLRLWEPASPAVILGRSSRIDLEVDRSFCDANSIPVMRRCSGGATVVAAPGCLMYAVVFPTADHPELAEVDRAHRFVLERLCAAFDQLGFEVSVAGASDLVWRERKFSGNSLRCKRDGLLYHGTLLYDADLDMIASCLKMPPKQPDYRNRRPHRDFLVNLPAHGPGIRRALMEAWDAADSLLSGDPRQDPKEWGQRLAQSLVRERYSLDTWNYQR